MKNMEKECVVGGGGGAFVALVCFLVFPCSSIFPLWGKAWHVLFSHSRAVSR